MTSTEPAPQGHGWEVRFSQSRQRPYFYSTHSKTSTWDPPASLSAPDLMALPGAEYLHGAVSGQGLGGALAGAGMVRASHLLVKHAQSRRPSSWKDENITRSKEDAIAILRTHEAELRPLLADPAQLRARFAALAEQHSDCSSHANGGDLGQFRKGQMQKPFEEAVYALKVDELSEVVDTESGVHLVLRTE